MYQFFVEQEQIMEERVQITGEDVNHIKNVLRMKPGEKIRVSDQRGWDYFCRIDQIEPDFVEAVVEQIDEAGSELPCKIYLFQGLPKSDKMELIIQKAVELGVYEIIPVSMKNCVMKLDEKKAKNKLNRWQAISESAAKQSKRSVIPEIKPVMTFKEAVGYAGNCDARLVPYENERGMQATKEAVAEAVKGKSIAVFIGPEGGFDPKEIAQVQDEMHLISLGKRILRTETAGLTTLSILMYELETAGQAQ